MQATIRRCGGQLVLVCVCCSCMCVLPAYMRTGEFRVMRVALVSARRCVQAKELAVALNGQHEAEARCAQMAEKVEGLLNLIRSEREEVCSCTFVCVCTFARC